jgi:hypothetical protein
VLASLVGVDIGGGGQAITNDQPSQGVTYLIDVGGSGSGLDVPGMIVPFLGNFAPRGYKPTARPIDGLPAQAGNTGSP